MTLPSASVPWPSSAQAHPVGPELEAIGVRVGVCGGGLGLQGRRGRAAGGAAVGPAVLLVGRKELGRTVRPHDSSHPLCAVVGHRDGVRSLILDLREPAGTIVAVGYERAVRLLNGLELAAGKAERRQSPRRVLDLAQQARTVAERRVVAVRVVDRADIRAAVGNCRVVTVQVDRGGLVAAGIERDLRAVGQRL